MIVITNKTETKLLHDLKQASVGMPLQKCFFMQFSEADVAKKKLQEAFLRLLDQLPNSYMAQVYICADYDIFILMQGFMQSQFTEFVEKLEQELQTNIFSDLIHIFEIGMDHDKLEKMCQQKIEMIEVDHGNTSEQDGSPQQNKALADAISKLDIDTIKNISKRRDVHANPVIMVVDDDQLSRTLVGNVLGQDFNMVYAKDGRAALESYVESAPDVLFLDIGLPDIGGHELLEVLSQIDPDNYIIMFSGRKNKDNMLRALQAGAQGFVGKPFTRNELLHYVEKSPFVQDKQDRSRTSTLAAQH